MRKILYTAKTYGVDWILVFVGLVDTYLSIYYTLQWHVYTGDRIIDGALFAIVVVLFAEIVFEFGVQFAIEKSHWSYLIFFLWAIVAVYSMQTTIAQQYIGVQRNRLAKLEGSRAEHVESASIEVLQKSLDSLRSQEKIHTKRLEQLNNISATVDSIEKMYEWKNTDAKVNQSYNRTIATLTELQGKISIVEEELKKAQHSAKIVELKGIEDNVFAFYSVVLGIKQETVEFALAVFKGIVLDLINSLCFMFVLIRNHRRKESKYEQVEEDSKLPEQLGEPEQAEPEESAKKEEDATPREETEWETSVRRIARVTFPLGKRPHSSLVPKFDKLETGYISQEQYNHIIKIGLYAGVLRQKGGKIYISRGVDQEEFERELLTWPR